MKTEKESRLETKAFGVTSGAGRDFLCLEEVSITLRTDGHKVGVLILREDKLQEPRCKEKQAE